MKSHIFDTENTFHTFLLLIPKGSMIRLNISEICIQWSIQGNNTKRLLVVGPRPRLEEWMNHLEFVTGLKMISTESNQGWTKRRVSAEQFWQKIGPFCGMIGWQPTILCNFLKYELDRASEREAGWAVLRICPHPGRDAIKLIRWLQTKRDIFLRWKDSLKFCCDSSLHWQRLMVNLAQNIPEISAR